MARLTSTNYTAQPFTYATAATDLFKKEDVQVLAQAVDTHDHATGKGLPINVVSGIPAGSITSSMIADGTIDTADLKDSAVTSLKIADGTIATADLANAAVTNAKLASDTARANLLTNGGFEIWQRGNGPFTATGAFLADRWQLVLQGTSTATVTRETVTIDSGSFASLKIVYSHNAGSAVQQKYEFGGLWGRTVTYSMRVWASAANAVKLAIFGSATSIAQSAYHPGGSTWQTLSVSTTVAGNETNFYVQVSLDASCTAYLDNAVLVVGSQAADYAPLHPADDLARCLRYYEKLGGANAVLWCGNGWSGANNSPVGQTFFYAVKKAVVPTLTKVGTWSASGCGQAVADLSDTSTFRIYALTNTTSASVSWGTVDATTYVTAEANP
jgi:hypothetical protein